MLLAKGINGAVCFWAFPSSASSAAAGVFSPRQNEKCDASYEKKNDRPSFPIPSKSKYSIYSSTRITGTLPTSNTRSTSDQECQSLTSELAHIHLRTHTSTSTSTGTLIAYICRLAAARSRASANGIVQT